MDDTRKYYLLIDTSTEVCTVALGLDDDTVVAERKNELQNKHAEVLAPLVNELLGLIPPTGLLAGVGVAEGPGSYTGLRIGAAYAKGLCWTRGLPLVAVSTPELLARTFVAAADARKGLLMPMIDARRMEVYTAIYTIDLKPIHDINALILTEQETMMRLSQEVGDSHLYFFGSGAEKAVDTMSQYFTKASFGGKISPEAGAMLPVVIDKIEAGKVEDIAYWEPYYLKEYEAKKSVNKVLREIIDK